MLRILRNKKTAKKIWIGLAIIIIPAFALWGFGGAFRSREETAPAGKIFGRNISNIEFKDSLAAVKTMMIMRFGDKLAEVQKYLNLEAQAWERLILLAEANKRRITASDQDVIEDIENSPYFRLRGAFNNKLYNETLRYSLRIQPRIFEELTRQNIIIFKLYEQATDKVPLRDEEVRKEYAKANQEMSIYYAGSIISDFAAKIKPSDKEIGDFFAKNKAMFKEPPAKDKPAQPARIPELIEIKDKVKQAFIRKAAQDLASEKIKECQNKLAAKDLIAAGRKLKLKTAATGLFKYGAFIENLGAAAIFWDTAYNLKENQPSRIISTPAGFYIIKIKSITPFDEARFTKEKADFSKKILLEKKQEYFNKFLEDLKKRA